jgi:hypothetical protein
MLCFGPVKLDLRAGETHKAAEESVSRKNPFKF